MSAEVTQFAVELEAERQARRRDDGLGFVGGDELVSMTPAEPEWVFEGYLARRSTALLAAEAKSGKSTITHGLVGAIVSGAGTFLGLRAADAPVVYLSEEGRATLLGKAAPSPRLRLLCRDDLVHPRPAWQEIVRAAVTEARRVDARLLVIDTVSWWAGLPADAENDAGAVGAALRPVEEAAAAGLAVLVVHHSGKAGDPRGSTAFAGVPDVIVQLKRRAGEPRVRELHAIGRWGTATPDVLAGDRDPDDGAWRVRGERAAEAASDARGPVLDALRTAGERISVAKVRAAAGRNNAAVTAALRQLGDEGLAEHGTGGWIAVPEGQERLGTAGTDPSLAAEEVVPGTGEPPRRGAPAGTPDGPEAVQ